MTFLIKLFERSRARVQVQRAVARKSFVFTFDALMGLAIAMVAASAIVALSVSVNEDHRVPSLSALARDYLVLKYSLNKSIVPSDVLALTNRTLVESPPAQAPGLVAWAEMILFPNLIDCAGLACAFANNSAQAQLLQKFDGDRPVKRGAWVRA